MATTTKALELCLHRMPKRQKQTTNILSHEKLLLQNIYFSEDLHWNPKFSMAPELTLVKKFLVLK